MVGSALSYWFRIIRFMLATSIDPSIVLWGPVECCFFGLVGLL